VETAKTVKGADSAADRYMLGKAYRLLGDMRRSAGDGVGATAAWQAAVAALPSVSGERPSEMRERAEIYRRLDRIADARTVEGKLAEMGYKYTVARAQM
jgi:hypothetical protein